MKKGVNYDSLKNNLSNYINNNNFKETLESLKKIKDKREYSELINNQLDLASNAAVKYFEQHEKYITKKKSNEIHNLLEFSEKFKKKFPKNETSKLEKTLKAFSVTAVLFSLLTNSSKITGNAISGGDFKTFSAFGTILFLMGIVGLFLTRKK